MWGVKKECWNAGPSVSESLCTVARPCVAAFNASRLVRSFPAVCLFLLAATSVSLGRWVPESSHSLPWMWSLPLDITSVRLSSESTHDWSHLSGFPISYFVSTYVYY